MKKICGSLCSLVVGVLTFVILSLNSLVVSTKVDEVTLKEGINSYTLLKGGVEEGYNLYKFSTLMMIVLAITLIIFSIVLFLKSINLIKANYRFNTINNILLAIFAVLALLSLIAIYAMTFKNKSIEIQSGAWLMLAISVPVFFFNLFMTAKQSH